MFLLKPATRGRPIPLRHRGANELFRRPRMGGGQVPGRFRHGKQELQYVADFFVDHPLDWSHSIATKIVVISNPSRS